MNPIEVTREPELDPISFRRITEMWFDEMTGDIFKEMKEAQAFIETLDMMIDAALEGGGEIHPERLLQLGAALGEACVVYFDGQWEFSDSQERWVVTCQTKNGETAALNVFNKLEKRVQNGDEDSITYFFNGNKALIEGTLAI